MRKIIEVAVKVGLTGAVAAILLLPSTLRVNSAESSDRPSGLTSLTLPPIEHLDTIPWFALKPQPQFLRIDTLLGPQFEMLGTIVASRSTDSNLALPPPSQTRGA